MGGERTQVGGSSSNVPDSAAIADTVREALASAGEKERYRLLAVVFEELAKVPSARPPEDGNAAGTRRSQALAEEKARLEDLLASTRADLDQRTRQLEAEQLRSAEDRQRLEEHRGRVDALRSERDELQAELTAKNSALHKAEVERDELKLAVQRLEAAGADQSKAERLEAARREMASELESARAALEQLRLDKDAQIERLKGEVSRAGTASAQSAERLMADVWERMARGTPTLVEGHVKPTPQAIEHLADAAVELTRFADDFDKAMRVFLEKYTRHHASVKVPWEVYARRDDVVTTVQQTLSPQAPRPVGLLKMRLRVLYSWCQAAMIGTDSALESIASELEAHLRGPLGTEADPNRKVKDYLRDDGHYLFMEHVRELRSNRLAETFGRTG